MDVDFSRPKEKRKGEDENGQNETDRWAGRSYVVRKECVLKGV